MAGHYLSKSNHYSEYIRKWIKKSIENESWNRFYDLHIDRIDVVFKFKSSWVDGSLYLFKLFYMEVDKTNFDFILAIPLNYSDRPTDINLIDIDYIKYNLGSTPPSFYLFPLNSLDFNKTIESSVYVESISKNNKFRFYFKEEVDDEEYFRVVYIKANE